MKTISLMLARFCLCAWFGAATLFVVTAIAEVSHPTFDSATRDELAKLRFPQYYTFGFTLVCLGLVFGWVARKHPVLGERRMKVFFALTIVALLMMVADYFWIYSALVSMLALSARPANFHSYHKASMYINSASLALVLVSSLLISWSGRRADGK
ncbi:MAG TPA: hypothetical protein VLA12_08385 [Planctomycetaceae bacterium]|nr:hypothetical protein [Planctomycetaceae bacterium]